MFLSIIEIQHTYVFCFVFYTNFQHKHKNRVLCDIMSLGLGDACHMLFIPSKCKFGGTKSY